MPDLTEIIYLIIVLICIWLFIRFLKNLFRIPKRRRRFYRRRFPRRRRFFRRRIKISPNTAFHKELHKLKRKKSGIPLTKNEMYRAAITASHKVIKRRGRKGHNIRQKIRKRLLEGHHVVKRYKMK